MRQKEARLFNSAEGYRSAAQQLNLQAAALKAAADAIMITDSNGTILWINQAFTDLTGYSAEEVMGRNPSILKSLEQDTTFYQSLWSTIASGKVWRGEIRNRKKDGSLYLEEMTITPVVSGNTITHFIAIKNDVTDRKNLEAQYRHAQKMEAVGRLAGGVAHDFNNILSVIMGYSQISLEQVPSKHPVGVNLIRIKSAAERAAALTKQLLAFSRQQVVYPRVIDLNNLVEHMTEMLQRMVGDDVLIHLMLSETLGSVHMDASQLEQVLMNLVVNSRDAMPHGGQITIQTRNIQLDDSQRHEHEPVRPGEYVMLAVSDNGCGMNDEVKARIFEPFFTTKEVGKGTGLGLATAYGIVKQSGGYIWVYSEPEEGSTFKIYLPRVNAPAEILHKSGPVTQSRGQGETILVVEDDEAVRELITTTLQNSNYLTLQAENAQAALQLLKENENTIQLMLSDVMMPGTNGVQLMSLAREVVPQLKVIFMSGYAPELLTQYEAALGTAAYIEKPFTKDELLANVFAVLHPC